MNNDFKSLGRYNITKSEINLITQSFGPTSAISIGNKKDFNEDCLRLGKNDSNYYFVVTDGHWGGESAEYMIGTLVDEFNSRINLILKESFNLSKIREELNTILQIHNNKIGHDSNSETTFLYVFVDNIRNQIIWVSVGDSFLYIIDENEKITENKKFQSWVGKRMMYNDLSDHSEIGYYSGDWKSLSLMTDGIPECIYGKETITTEMIVNEINNTKDSHELVKILCNKALEFGGEDNIAIISVFKHELK